MLRGTRTLVAVTGLAIVTTGLSTGLTWSAAASAPVNTTVKTGAKTTAGTTGGSTADGERALRRLRADASGRLRVHHAVSGVVDFVGTSADGVVDNPARTFAGGPVQAARQDLDRYGDALGVTDPGSQLTLSEHRHSVAGGSVVRFDQTVSGLPVIGGQVVVNLDGNGDLSSLQATTTTAASVTTKARVRPAAAAGTALRVAAASHRVPARSLTVSDQGLWVFDPSVLGASSANGAETVRRLEVSNGSDVREVVLVDARSGRVVLHFNNVQEALNRRVCNQAGLRAAATACTTGAARSEGQVPTGDAEVNKAYDLSGGVATFYDQIGGIDLTEMIGFGTAGSRTLGSTVRHCTNNVQELCPYANAFWNGQQMFYGTGFADADDVVGHEMTHGVIERASDLFYFFQSGAINESLADIMGEIVDHRFVSDGDTTGDWRLGEDLPEGAIRDLADPTRYNQPDKMTSTRYVTDAELQDSGGVHTNSGVGNKTAYLISQGGTFNGVTLAGIDAGDPTLTKTATLYLGVLSSLSSGSDYADLGRVLNQGCADLAGAGRVGFTVADCANVAKAVQATELARQPTTAGAATPAEAPVGCPTGQTERVLFDDETAPESDEMTRESLWLRAPDGSMGLPSNATSGQESWFGWDPDPLTYRDPATSTMSVKQRLTVPAGGRTYLRFNHWFAFDYQVAPETYYDGGLVLVDDLGDTNPARQTATLPWVNGPARTVVGSGATPVKGFGGVSAGYRSSRLDLSSFAGRTITPRFQVVGDDQYSILGWYLDDVEVYTCGADLPSKPVTVRVAGSHSAATVAWTAPAYAGDGVTGYRVTGTNGLTRTLSGTARSTRFTGLKAGTAYTFTVRALNVARVPGAAATVVASGTKLALGVTRTGIRNTRVWARLLTHASRPLAGRRVAVQRLRPDRTWATVKTVVTGSQGTVVLVLGGRSRAAYRLVFPGGTALIGSVSLSKHL